MGKNNLVLLLLLATLITASFLRLWQIRDYIVFLGDEGRDALVWHRMVAEGDFTFLGPTASVGGFYLGPIYYYLALPFYWLWQDPAGPAVFVALIGVATVWLVWHIGNRWFGPVAGLWAAWSYAIAALVIRYSRASWNPNPLPFFSVLGMYLTATGVQQRQKWKIVGAGICLGIAWQLHYLALVLTAVYAAIIAYEHFFHRAPAKDRKWLSGLASHLLLLGVGWAAGFAPFLAFEVYHNFPNSRTVTEFISRPGGAVLDFELLGLARSVIRNINRLFFTVLSWPDGPQTNLVALVVSLVGTVATIAVGRWALLIWFYLGIALFSLYQGSIADYYFGFLFPAPFLLAGAASQRLWDLRSSVLARAALLLVLAALTVDQSRRWFINLQPNRILQQTEAVANEVLSLASGSEYNFALITDGNSDHAYRYFLERSAQPPVPLEEKITDQLIAVCEKPQAECQPLGNPIWEIAGFGRAEIESQATIPPGITIYRLTHYQVDMIRINP